MTLATIERALVDYFDATGVATELNNGEWIAVLPEDADVLSLTAIAAAILSRNGEGEKR